MTVRYAKFKSICRNCGVSGEGYRYVKLTISNISFTICPSCADLLTRQLRSMSYDSKKQVER